MMTRYKNIKANAQYNLFDGDSAVENESVAEFEVKPAVKPVSQKRQEDKEDVGVFGAVETAPTLPTLRFISFGSGLIWQT